MTTAFLIGMLILAVAGQVEAPSVDSAPADAATTSDSTSENPPTAAQETPEQQSQPVRPRRGAAPTLDRISGTTYIVNPDGTMRSQSDNSSMFAEQQGHSPPSTAEFPNDPSYAPRQRATVSSINNSSAVESPDEESPDITTMQNAFKLDGALLYVAIGGGLFLIGAIAGLIGRLWSKA